MALCGSSRASSALVPFRFHLYMCLRLYIGPDVRWLPRSIDHSAGAVQRLAGCTALRLGFRRSVGPDGRCLPRSSSSGARGSQQFAAFWSFWMAVAFVLLAPRGGPYRKIAWRSCFGILVQWFCILKVYTAWPYPLSFSQRI